MEFDPKKEVEEVVLWFREKPDYFATSKFPRDEVLSDKYQSGPFASGLNGGKGCWKYSGHCGYNPHMDMHYMTLSYNPETTNKKV